MKLILLYISIIIISATFAASAFSAEEVITLESGLKYQDLVFGNGETAEEGKIATIHIIGWLNDSGQKRRKFFDSHEQGQPIRFKIGTNKVMKAWNQGVVGMKAGGKRVFIVPAALGYGKKGVDDNVPLNSDLILEIELIYPSVA
jgi:FKBP-type peptidyl-prolyl cis-trans isomerase